MFGDTLSAAELVQLPEKLVPAVEQATSLESFKAWLEAQPCVASVQTQPYLIETLPPQKEYEVTFKLEDGSTAIRIISVYVREGPTFELAAVSEP